jgi:hypothetical protein
MDIPFGLKPTALPPAPAYPVIQGLWVGDKALHYETTMHCLFPAPWSSLPAYTYGAVENVPAGTEICDGSQVIFLSD